MQTFATADFAGYTLDGELAKLQTLLRRRLNGPGGADALTPDPAQTDLVMRSITIKG